MRKNFVVTESKVISFGLPGKTCRKFVLARSAADIVATDKRETSNVATMRLQSQIKRRRRGGRGVNFVVIRSNP